MKRIIMLIVTLGSFLLANAVSVQAVAEKNTYRVLVPLSEGMSTGTGFFINKQGYMITNNHVVEGHHNTFIVKNSLAEYKDVQLVKTYPKHDIAILKINNYVEKTFLKLQNPSSIKKGLDIYALGFPGGADMLEEGLSFNASLSGGLISKIDVSRDSHFPQNYKFIQIDAVINHGNSGGPLLSRKGTVLGINTLGRNDTQGIFWSIHVEELMKVLDSNGIKYSVSFENVEELDTRSLQENISSVESNSKFLFIAIAMIVGILIFMLYWLKRNANRSVKSGELSKLIRDKMKKYKNGDELLARPSPKVKERTTAIVESLISENSSLPTINLESKKSLLVGRSRECDIRIDDSAVSKQHLRISLLGNQIEIEDLASGNGTYIGGIKLDAYQKVILEKDKQLVIASEHNVYKIKSSQRKRTFSSIILIPQDPTLPTMLIDRRMTVGRSSTKVDIQINHNEVSRIHLELQIQNTQVLVRDLDSGNGTYINGIQVHKGETSYLSKGDELFIGSAEVIYTIK